MRIKKILSLAVVLAMVMAVVPAFGLTASADAATNKVEFTLKMDTGYKDIKITDLNGKVITGFVLAAANDGFFPFVREESNNGDGLLGEGGDVAGFKGAGTDSGIQTKMHYTNGSTKITIEITNGEGEYTVKYTTDGALDPVGDTLLPGYNVSRTYTGATVTGIATPDKWITYGEGWANNTGVTPNTICNYLTNMTITNGESVAESKTLTVTYDGKMSDKSFTYKAPVGTTVDIPAYAETAS